ncbi:hypothetical protein SLS63_000889 [Diaporthe eres]|uniref:AAA+ ATPase domain-containing protein n=1 Tax=Diaporthe eres TaxID=83184 RepID=A0ABR1PNW5_DIAER
MAEVGVGDTEKIRQHFVDRGKKWYDIQRSKKCYQFEGITTAYPRTSTSSIEFLHVSGFKEAAFDTALFEKLVLNEVTKKMIRDLTEMYIRDTAKPVSRDALSIKLTSVHKAAEPREKVKTWSADFVQGKGEGLTILLHGKPGVGKTYTADYTKRPLLSLTCSDIGVEPTKVERNLIYWFDMAQSWGAIVLIDEADIFMEERQPQDLARNHLVAGFLRALEYFKGIVFLTTNRVGTFDEAFISRIHVPIYYGEFTPEQRIKVWDTFFEKLELDREKTMRILSSAKDYVDSSELQNLKWNGREIRNAFQVAVALAEAQGQRDDKGRVLIKKEHIKATVDMSKEFSDYLNRVHKADLSKKAAMMGTRFDAYDSGAGSTSTSFKK